MKKFLQFVSIIMILAACGKEAEVPEWSCDLKTFENTVNQDQLQVVYKLEANGDYTLASWFYYSENGRIEVTNPLVPSEITVTLSAQQKMQAGAIGKVINGRIKVGYKAITADTTYIGVDQCVQEQGKK
jgi:outer membrane biogenesis lipoprotein LolB